MEGQSLLKECFYRFLTLCGPLKAFKNFINFFNLKLSCLLFKKYLFFYGKKEVYILRLKI